MFQQTKAQSIVGSIDDTNKEVAPNKLTVESFLDSIYERFEDIEACLKKRIESKDKHKLYFSGEADSNQTKFESESNNLKIAVLSNNRTVALVLLRFVRVIVDYHPSLINYDLEELTGKVTMDDIINQFAKWENTYLQKHEFNQTISRKLYGHEAETTIEVSIDDIDIWTLTRVMAELKTMFLKKQKKYTISDSILQ